MPSLQSILLQPDSVTVVTKRGTRTLTRADIPANVINKPLATIEAFANTWLTNNLPDFQAVVHIAAVNPQLDWLVLTADPGMTIQPNWWLVHG